MHRTRSKNSASHLAAVLLATMVLLTAGARGWADSGEPEASSDSDRGAVRVRIETIVVDRFGTNTVANDEADLFPGQSGVLNKSITLKGREGSKYREEQVDLTTRIALGQAGRPGCPLMLAIVAVGAPLGMAPETPSDAERSALSLTLEAGETRMTPAYISPWTRARISLRITCGEAEQAIAPGASSLMAFDVALERGEDESLPRLLRSDRLSTTLGGEAGSLFSSNTPLPDTVDGERRYRRERLDVRVAPRILSGGRLQVEVRLQGEVATISASGTDGRHPIDLEESLVLASGESGDIELTVTASPVEAGWSSIQYLLRVTARF